MSVEESLLVHPKKETCQGTRTRTGETRTVKGGWTSWEEQECLVWAGIAQKQGSRVEEVRAEQQSSIGGGTV